MKPVLIRQHVDGAPPALLAEWLDERKLRYEVSRSWLHEPLPDPRKYSFLISLGHDAGAHETHLPAVAAEIDLLRQAIAADVPVLGLCFGGQALAAALGAKVERAPTAELGWREIITDDPNLIPAGPWLEWHYDRFTTPANAIEIARTADAPQAFRLGPHLGVQFHPEATIEIVTEWAESDGVPDQAPEATPEQRAAAREAAFRLFDAFLAHADQNRTPLALSGG
ncbi:MAG TPA: gamma-glutamyl-gamma-aminobutyrate hydrolase family protein [Solirubrobacteraceae bacterium]|nr:gamma-glutamyl-gamma-aminobutyrate hydrolase family protein [Solirubrobacteraceae bacterium]